MTKVHEFHTDSFAESLTYFPEPEDYRTGPEEYLETIADGEEGGADADHRQPQRREQGRLGPLREDDARRRGRRPGVEHLLRGRRPGHDQPGRGIPLPRPGGRREAVDLDSAGGQGGAVLQRHGQHGRAAGRGGRRRTGAVQPLLPARHRPGDAWRREPEAPPELALRVVAAAAVDRHPARPASRPRWPPPAASTTPPDC